MSDPWEAPEPWEPERLIDEILEEAIGPYVKCANCGYIKSMFLWDRERFNYPCDRCKRDYMTGEET